MLSRSHIALTLLGSALLVSCSVVDRPTKEVRPAEEDRPAGPRIAIESQSAAYSYQLPEGWDSAPDEESLFGVTAMIFEKGSSFREGRTVMYLTEPCTSACAGKLGEVVDRVLAAAREESPALVVSIGDPLPTKSGHAEVRILSGAKDERQAREALAFVERPEVVLLLVLSTSDVSRWDRDYRAFAHLLRGLEFLPAPVKL